MFYLRDFEDIKTICRVCLNKDKVLILLNNYLYGDSSERGPLISEVLGHIMCTQIEDNYPKVICPKCLDHVKQAYNLRLKFEKSQEVLQKYEQSIIVSFKNNDQFEVYEDVAPNYDLLHDSYDSLKATNDFESSENISDLEDPPIIIKDEIFVESLCTTPIDVESRDGNFRKRERSETFGKMIGEYDLNVKKTFKLKLEKSKEKVERNNIQVRCVDINKFIIEKRIEQNNSNLNLPSVVPDEQLNSINLADNKLTKKNCPICNKLYSKGKLKNHVRLCRNLKITSLTCKECNKVFKKITHLNYHTKLKHSSNPPTFPCKICGFICKNSSARQIHMLEKHGNSKSVICETCGKGFYHNAHLLRHRAKHTRETQEICNVCGKFFHYKGALFYHMKMHTNERKYLCNFCDKKFFTLQVLRRHIDSHTGDRRFKCKFCDKAFRSSSERRRHEMIHTGEKPHHCEYCEKTFKSKYNRDVHVSAHRGEQPCYICGGKFLNAEVVNLHTKFKHKVKLDGTTVETNIERDDQ